MPRTLSMAQWTGWITQYRIFRDQISILKERQRWRHSKLYQIPCSRAGKDGAEIEAVQYSIIQSCWVYKPILLCTYLTSKAPPCPPAVVLPVSIQCTSLDTKCRENPPSQRCVIYRLSRISNEPLKNSPHSQPRALMYHTILFFLTP